MSHSTDGKQLLCDKHGCTARVDAPVALNPTSTATNNSSSVGLRWLFVQQSGVWKHFCPEHTGAALFGADATAESRTSSLSFRSLLLAVDRSPASFAAAQGTLGLIDKNSDTSLTVLFTACARCAPRPQTTTTGRTLTLPSFDDYCPGTRKALLKLTGLFTDHNIPIQLQVKSDLPLRDWLQMETAQKSYEVIVVPPVFTDELPSNISVPLLILPSGDTDS